ncbi:VOC family protein [Knoellia subterranea]|uniref:PhnB protein n=1 Tax=Knoellia subterranea KCTC 19937 TaxID=1385521 RepID=A0A0A0JJI8_9MICO|nr:VOC family protein [Knoellia subterranea]KGN37545.1 PhnB protein [Knoellia subterranea KCTC 19937]
MATTLNPYIQFKDNAREAIEFYASVFGGEHTISTFGDFAEGNPDHEAVADGVMHAQLVAPNGLTLMADDTPPGMPSSEGSSISISLSGDDAEELRGYWDKLSDGGQVMVPLEKQMWGDEFGMCADRFGIAWMVNIAGEQPAAE